MGMAFLNAFFRFAKQVFYENMGKMLNDYLCNCDLTIVVGLIDFFFESFAKVMRINQGVVVYPLF